MAVANLKVKEENINLSSSCSINTTRALIALELTVERLAHSIRTHLGIANGVISDIAAGYPFDKTDVEDATKSIAIIVSYLHQLSSLNTSFNSTISDLVKLQELGEVIKTAVIRNGAGVSLDVIGISEGDLISRVFVECAEKGAHYITSKIIRQCNHPLLDIKIRSHSKEEVSLVLSSPLKTKNKQQCAKNITEFYKIISKDSAPESLSLLYIAELIFSNNGKLRLDYPNNTIELTMLLPLFQ